MKVFLKQLQEGHTFDLWKYMLVCKEHVDIFTAGWMPPLNEMQFSFSRKSRGERQSLQPTRYSSSRPSLTRSTTLGCQMKTSQRSLQSSRCPGLCSCHLTRGLPRPPRKVTQYILFFKALIIEPTPHSSPRPPPPTPARTERRLHSGKLASCAVFPGSRTLSRK